MTTKAQTRKMQKRKAREKAIRKAHNVRQNNLSSSVSVDRYRLDVFIGGILHSGVMSFKDWDSVLAHKTDTEARRAKGDTIVAGRVVDLRSGLVVMEIAQSEPKPMKGEMKDGMAASAAGKAVPSWRAKEAFGVG
jgi:exosome complex RNA-binding protein Csl4